MTLKLTRYPDIAPLYDFEVEIEVCLKRTLAGPTFVVTGMTSDGIDLYDHPDPELADAFLKIAHKIQGLVEADDSILDDLLEDEKREAA
ncbi:hypothetical protein [Nitratireductor sp. GCM10026969]|uniref:hypothetical protein n=1 Tax=Nitratireductor sp. GCM10026969 TaxID=3252645 RepID=UPI003608B099